MGHDPSPLGNNVPPPAHIWVGSIAKNSRYKLYYHCAEFDAFTLKCTIHLFFLHHMGGLLRYISILIAQMKGRLIKMNISSRKYIMNFYSLLMKGKSVDPLGSLQLY